VPNMYQPGSLPWWRQRVNDAGYMKSLEQKHPWAARAQGSPANVMKTMRARPAAPVTQPTTAQRRPKQYVTISATNARNLQTRILQAQWALLHSGVEANQALARSLAKWASFLDDVLSQ